jgi:hypothetical protein
MTIDEMGEWLYDIAVDSGSELDKIVDQLLNDHSPADVGAALLRASELCWFSADQEEREHLRRISKRKRISRIIGDGPSACPGSASSC